MAANTKGWTLGMEWAGAVGLLAAAAVLLAGGAELFAEHAASAGRQLGISGLAGGLLLAGAEPEELVTAVLAAVRGQPGIAAGDAIGANITLLTLVIGGLALIAPVDLSGRGRRYVMAALVASASAWGVLVDESVTPVEGAGLVVMYGLLVGGIWWFERDIPAIGELSELHDDDDARPGRSPAVGLVLALAGVAAMGAGGWLAVAGAERLIDLAGVGGSVVGLTAVALATTAEFIALVPAAVRRGVPELAAAGIVGSVLYNATVTLGAAALVGTLTNTGVGAAAAVAAILTAVIAVLARLRGRLGHPTAVVLLAGYVAYVAVVWR